MRFYHSSDYAGAETTLGGRSVSFYYGYEHTDPVTDEWLFVTIVNGELVWSLKQTEIESMFDTRDLVEMQDYLLAGILVAISKLDGV